MEGAAATLLQPIDPTATGEAEATSRVRSQLKRKRDEAHGAETLTTADTWVPPTAAAKSCVHEVAVPSGFTGSREELLSPKYDGPPAKTYPFVLDPFQSTAVACLARAPAFLAEPSRLSRHHHRSGASPCWWPRTRLPARRWWLSA